MVCPSRSPPALRDRTADAIADSSQSNSPLTACFVQQVSGRAVSCDRGSDGRHDQASAWAGLRPRSRTTC